MQTTHRLKKKKMIKKFKKVNFKQMDRIQQAIWKANNKVIIIS